MACQPCFQQIPAPSGPGLRYLGNQQQTSIVIPGKKKGFPAGFPARSQLRRRPPPPPPPLWFFRAVPPPPLHIPSVTASRPPCTLPACLCPEPPRPSPPGVDPATSPSRRRQQGRCRFDLLNFFIEVGVSSVGAVFSMRAYLEIVHVCVCGWAYGVQYRTQACTLTSLKHDLKSVLQSVQPDAP